MPPLNTRVLNEIPRVIQLLNINLQTPTPTIQSLKPQIRRLRNSLSTLGNVTNDDVQLTFLLADPKEFDLSLPRYRNVHAAMRSLKDAMNTRRHHDSLNQLYELFGTKKPFVLGDPGHRAKLVKFLKDRSPMLRRLPASIFVREKGLNSGALETVIDIKLQALQNHPTDTRLRNAAKAVSRHRTDAIANASTLSALEALKAFLRDEEVDVIQRTLGNKIVQDTEKTKMIRHLTDGGRIRFPRPGQRQLWKMMTPRQRLAFVLIRRAIADNELRDRNRLPGALRGALLQEVKGYLTRPSAKDKLPPGDDDTIEIYAKWLKSHAAQKKAPTKPANAR